MDSDTFAIIFLLIIILFTPIVIFCAMGVMRAHVNRKWEEYNRRCKQLEKKRSKLSVEEYEKELEELHELYQWCLKWTPRSLINISCGPVYLEKEYDDYGNLVSVKQFTNYSDFAEARDKYNKQ